MVEDDLGSIIELGSMIHDKLGEIVDSLRLSLDWSENSEKSDLAVLVERRLNLLKTVAALQDVVEYFSLKDDEFKYFSESETNLLKWTAHDVFEIIAARICDYDPDAS